MQNRAFLLVFFFVAVAEILIQVFGWQEYNLFIKPLIVPSLIAFYIQNADGEKNLFVLALLFCWLGDVFLLFDRINEFYFMGGLGAFLIGHVLLIFLYGKLKNVQGNGLNGPQKARVSFPIILAGTGLISILYPTLGTLKIPVIVYALALIIMVIYFNFKFLERVHRSAALHALRFIACDQQIFSADCRCKWAGNRNLYGRTLFYCARSNCTQDSNQLNDSNGNVSSNSVY